MPPSPIAWSSLNAPWPSTPPPFSASSTCSPPTTTTGACWPCSPISAAESAHNPGPDGQYDPIDAMGVAVSTDPQPSTQGSAAAPDPQLEAPPEQSAPAAPPLPPQHKIRPTRLSGLWFAVVFFAVVLLFLLIFILQNRSEERRVGKECRSRWSP